MDDGPDGGCSWQAWKFGMKREDLYTKLQDQYNTVAFSIQDPDAFHHDVCEISKIASDNDEFHRLLDERKQVRLDQLSQSLQSASVEIIANPKLIGTEQWQYAIQLFRTRSFDSLVRYFASYLPDDHEWSSSAADPTTKPFFDDEIDGPTSVMTHEPLSFIDTTCTSMIPSSHLPPSPRSLTTCSEDSSSVSTPSRTHSFSEPESDAMMLSTTLARDFGDEYPSQWDAPDTPTTSVSDTSEFSSLDDVADTKHYDLHGRISSAPSVSENVEDEQDLETPTPREGAKELCLHVYQTTPIESIESMASLSTTLKVSPSKYTTLQQRVRDASPGLSRARRRSPEIGRIQKPVHDTNRIRPKSLKR
ncbi:hypothetical protein F5Y18DRAFT_413673 [Xylariaceae sp. FL1019]|nr:hypothetical protein F5Y18DRAFT_413673 [Xylariaceae sp. FL1019]